MTAKKFKFVSPGIFIDEIDNSQLPNRGAAIGPVVIGRLERGPAMRPVHVNSFSEFVEMFGNPMPGGKGGDVWRDGNYTAPTYAGYAAQAWLRNNSPLNVVRLLGVQHSKASGNGVAGWDMGDVSAGKAAGAGGAYGLFLTDAYTNDMQAAGGSGPPRGMVTGALAAVWYLNRYTSIELSGTAPFSGTVAITGTSTFIATGSGGSHEFTALIRSGTAVHAGGNMSAGHDAAVEKVVFNFNRNSQNYIRRVFNTNPTLVNTTTTQAGAAKGYFLGQTYDQFIEDTFKNGTVSEGILMGLSSRTNDQEYAGNGQGMANGGTGWLISQDLGNAAAYSPENMQKLFRLRTLDGGEWAQNNLKVSIQDVIPSTNDSDPYGSFTVVLRKMNDTDNAPKFVEVFSNCTMNPNSTNYVARKIGDKFRTWDEDIKAYKEFGKYTNISRFMYVEMNEDVDAGVTDPRYIPVGVYGHKRPKSVKSLKGSNKTGVPAAAGHIGIAETSHTDAGTSNIASVGANAFLKGGEDGILLSPGDGGWYMAHATGTAGASTGGGANFTASFYWPTVAFRESGLQGKLTSPRRAYWGPTTYQSGTTKFDPSVREPLRALPEALGAFSTGVGPSSEDSTYTEDAWIFTLEDLSGSDTGHGAHYLSGSRRAGTSITAVNDLNTLLETQRLNKFTTFFAHGFDGLDITEKEPFRNSVIDGTEDNNYVYHSVHRAIDALHDAEVVEYNLATMPGLTNTALTEHLIHTCEDRGDALAIIDLENDYVPSTENLSSESARRGSVESAVNSLRNRNINSSYGCAYYPWVQVRDSFTNAIVWMPPSVVALGTMSFSETQRALWFAPAGFTRGGLTMGSSGLNVVGVRQHLTSQDRDRLYASNVNPIASFPAEGIVIFGQKTLQVTPSALDRINVRRLLIFTKKEVSRIAATTLFEQNVRTTWNAFSSQVETFLNDIKAGFGLMDFKVVLDETTTTPEMIDRNIMYAKVFLKPARAIEFIALDFVITDSGASFAD